uniref:HTH CENPB-type domain-containing protein n=1 Tax=Globisporangium ultimum (strain ATCC 200006 / CBS 805.95 / DAOM BR144) TaxID=431595 RepID=K3XAT3_GLOUD
MSYARNFLTNEQKLQLREYWAENPELSHFEVADWVAAQFQIQISRSTLYRISQAPVTAFAGNLHQKKGRRVKYPEFESELVAFYHACRRRSGSGSGEDSGEGAQQELTVELLLRKAVELRTKHGIPQDKLKLSNGWMHKFKDRHFLKTHQQNGAAERHAPEQVGGEGETENKRQRASAREQERDVATPQVAAAVATMAPASTTTPTRATRSPPMTATSDERATIDTQTTEPTIVPPAPVAVTAVTSIISATSAVTATAATTAPAHASAVPVQVSSSTLQIRPLTHIAAKSLNTVHSQGTFNWERTSGAADAYFAIVNDGIQIFQDGMYQVNVDLEHTKHQGGTSGSDPIFNVWNDAHLIGRCTCSVHCDPVTGAMLSVVEIQTFLKADSVVRVEFLAPGFALHQSRIVIRLLS